MVMNWQTMSISAPRASWRSRIRSVPERLDHELQVLDHLRCGPQAAHRGKFEQPLSPTASAIFDVEAFCTSCPSASS